MEIDGDQTARMFFLAIIAMSALASVFALYRGRLSAGLQNAAVWGLIFAGLLVAYGFRDRIGLALVEAAPETLDGEVVALRRGRDGHFHARITVNGREVEFLVDTGATDVVLSPADARRVGIDMARLRYTIEAQTANGTVRAAPVTLETMRIGPFDDRDVPAVVNEVPIARSLLGLGYLDRFGSLTIAGDRLTLAR